MAMNRIEFLHKRGPNNEILPVTVELEDGSGEVVMTPLGLGEINLLVSQGKKGKDVDVKDPAQAEILAKHLVDPVFTAVEFLDDGFKAFKYAQLMKALLRVSGMDEKKKQ